MTNYKCKKCGYPDAACPEQVTGNCGRMVRLPEPGFMSGDQTIGESAYTEKQIHSAYDMLLMLLMMDQEFDSAHDMLCEAKRERGNWNVNPLKHDHPAVMRKRRATDSRQSAIAAVQDFLNGEPR